MKAVWLTATLLSAALTVGACGRDSARSDASAPANDSSGLLDTPYPIEPFAAVDLAGQDRSPGTWKGRVVVLNVWATWCGPCRREMPSLQRLQDTFADRVLVLGLLDDTVTDEFVRAFLDVAKVRYPIVRSTFDIESRLPPVVRLPMTFVFDRQGRLAGMYVGEVDEDRLVKDVGRLLGT